MIPTGIHCRGAVLSEKNLMSRDLLLGHVGEFIKASLLMQYMLTKEMKRSSVDWVHMLVLRNTNLKQYTENSLHEIFSPSK